MPTASAVVADLIDLAVGRAQRTFQTQKLWHGEDRGVTLRPATTVRSRFYLRAVVVDRPGVMADIARELSQHQISISSLIQHEAVNEEENAAVSLVIMTHTASHGEFPGGGRGYRSAELRRGPKRVLPGGGLKEHPMSVDPIVLHGIVREGVIVPDLSVKLPEGIPVKILVAHEDLPTELLTELVGQESDGNGPGGPADQWERME